LRPGILLDAHRSSLTAATTYTLMSTDRKIEDLFRQYRHILQTIGLLVELRDEQFRVCSDLSEWPSSGCTGHG
jgi:hypothetical protein